MEALVSTTGETLTDRKAGILVHWDPNAIEIACKQTHTHTHVHTCSSAIVLSHVSMSTSIIVSRVGEHSYSIFWLCSGTNHIFSLELIREIGPNLRKLLPQSESLALPLGLIYDAISNVL